MKESLKGYSHYQLRRTLLSPAVISFILSYSMIFHRYTQTLGQQNEVEFS